MTSTGPNERPFFLRIFLGAGGRFVLDDEGFDGAILHILRVFSPVSVSARGGWEECEGSRQHDFVGWRVESVFIGRKTRREDGRNDGDRRRARFGVGQMERDK